MNQQYDTNERYFLMNIFNNVNDVYNAIYEYDNFIPEKLQSNENYRLMISIINFTNAINTELNKYKINFDYDMNKKRKLENI